MIIIINLSVVFINKNIYYLDELIIIIAIAQVTVKYSLSLSFSPILYLCSSYNKCICVHMFHWRVCLYRWSED